MDFIIENEKDHIWGKMLRMFKKNLEKCQGNTIQILRKELEELERD